jgi:hypothetical protein
MLYSRKWSSQKSVQNLKLCAVANNWMVNAVGQSVPALLHVDVMRCFFAIPIVTTAFSLLNSVVYCFSVHPASSWVMSSHIRRLPMYLQSLGGYAPSSQFIFEISLCPTFTVQGESVLLGTWPCWLDRQEGL